MIRASPYTPSHLYPLILRSSPSSVHSPEVHGIYVFFCNCMSSRLAPFPSHSLPWSDGRASFLFSYSSTLQLSTCLLQSTSLLAGFPPSHSRFLFFNFSASVLPICLFSVHTTLYKMSLNFFQTKGWWWCAAAPNPNCRNIPFIKSSMSLYQSAILTPSTSTSVCTALRSSCHDTWGSEIYLSNPSPTRPM